ncbi:unnamed protein product [Musa banksii]
MAAKEEDVEYESDLEDAPLPTMRRREASDDEEGEGSDERGKPARDGLRAEVGSEGESDGEGGAEVYDDEEEYYYDEEEDELGDGVEERLGGREEEALEVGGNHVAVGTSGKPRESRKSPEPQGDEQKSDGNLEENQEDKNQVEEEEKKENEPYAVPTAGSFYMHDDRFQENGRGRHRRMFGGRKLWDPKDERAWVHDRFEEMNLQDIRNNEERRGSRRRFRGRGRSKSQGAEGGYVRGNRYHTSHDEGNNQGHAPRTVRGRGPRCYEPIPKNKGDFPAAQSKRSLINQQESPSIHNTGRQSSRAASVKSEFPRKNTFASSLNSASPPFYPSGSSNQDITLNQKRDVQTGSINKAVAYSTQMRNDSNISQSNSLMQGKIATDMVGHDRFYTDPSLLPAAGKTSANPKEFTHSASSRVQGRGLSSAGPLNSHSGSLMAAQIKPTVRPVQVPTQPAIRSSTQQVVEPLSNGRQASPPQPPSVNSSEVGEADSSPGSSKSKISLAEKGRISNQGIGKGSFLYGGAQVIGATGAMGLAHTEQNFPGTPALLPVMQLGNQHPGGIGVPAMGMALPGYVAQPQLGFGNSEMTWVPVLAGAAGALGASYCPPYVALDGNYYARPSGQTSSRESSTNKPGSSLKLSQRPEIANEELGERQNKPRSRYSEMNFGQ